MSTRIYVGGLDLKIEDRHLQKKFGKYGEITSCSIKEKKDIDGNVVSKFAYINLVADKQTVQECISYFDGATWKGGDLKVQLARESFLDRLKREREGREAPIETPYQQTNRFPRFERTFEKNKYSDDNNFTNKTTHHKSRDNSSENKSIDNQFSGINQKKQFQRFERTYEKNEQNEYNYVNKSTHHKSRGDISENISIDNQFSGIKQKKQFQRFERIYEKNEQNEYISVNKSTTLHKSTADSSENISIDNQFSGIKQKKQFEKRFERLFKKNEQNEQKNPFKPFEIYQNNLVNTTTHHISGDHTSVNRATNNRLPGFKWKKPFQRENVTNDKRDEESFFDVPKMIRYDPTVQETEENSEPIVQETEENSEPIHSDDESQHIFGIPTSEDRFSQINAGVNQKGQFHKHRHEGNTQSKEKLVKDEHVTQEVKLSGQPQPFFLKTMDDPILQEAVAWFTEKLTKHGSKSYSNIIPTLLNNVWSGLGKKRIKRF